ncbi:MAG TPA: hypothetical protein ENJ09_07260 [Planctomycetes bacterium]|nr:hypothetical protein [Planctomycetota bacterium]
MHPVLFHIPGLGFPIRSFGVLVAAGMFLGIWVWGKLLERYGDDPVQDPIRSSQVAVWVVVGVMAGARLLYVTVEVSRTLGADLTEQQEAYLASDRGPQAASLLVRTDPSGPEALEEARKVEGGYDFLHDPLKVLFVWQGGLVMYGGLAGAILLGLWSSKRHGLDPWNALDTCLVAGFLGLAIGRWGCLLVGDDFGSLVPPSAADLPFPITVTVPSAEWLANHPQSLFPHDLAGKTIWATQIWMSANAILLFLIGWFLLRWRRWRGQVAAVLIALYAVGRFTIENFRGDEIRGVWFGGALSTSQLISILGLALGLILLVAKPGPPARRDEEPAGEAAEKSA